MGGALTFDLSVYVLHAIEKCCVKTKKLETISPNSVYFFLVISHKDIAFWRRRDQASSLWDVQEQQFVSLATRGSQSMSSNVEAN